MATERAIRGTEGPGGGTQGQGSRWHPCQWLQIAGSLKSHDHRELPQGIHRADSSRAEWRGRRESGLSRHETNLKWWWRRKMGQQMVDRRAQQHEERPSEEKGCEWVWWRTERLQLPEKGVC